MAVEAFGVFTGILGVIQFGIDNIPTPVNEGATIAIKVGSGGVQTDDFGGVITRVDGFDAGNQFIGGYGARTSAARGDVLSITINQDNPDIQTQYVSITAGDDNICIASVAISQRDGAELGYGWLGDVGMRCNVPGVNFMPQNQVVGSRAEGGTPHAPFCTWFEEGFPGTTFKFNGAGYVGEENRNDDAYCRNTIFSSSNFPIPEQPGARRRSVSSVGPGRERPAEMANSLVISSIDTHNMTELCGNERMWGPDFIGVDDVYCDVGTHTAYPLCSRSDVDDCVVLDKLTKTLSRKSPAAAVARGASLFQALHTFSNVEEWLHPV